MLHYTKYQHKTSKEWVTFVHGAGDSSTIWYKQIRDFKKHFNILLLDLRGHGNSKPNIKDAFNDKYTFDSITADIIEVLDYEKVKASHFIGISLGTILIRNLAEKYSDRVRSMVMGGAIMKLNLRSQILMRLGVVFKSIVPYIWLYKFFAFVIMPNKNHRESRSLFVREAKKLYQKEFIRWFKLTSEINPLLRFFRAVDVKIPTFYIMGGEDYLFLPTIRKVVNSHVESTLFVIEDCGHVVNVEEPIVFNERVISYLQNVK
ncbi:alpha/beta fold hydrolase [Allomuricauda sp. R78024]|uniref:alpha/beta fold hydrolase n=1 Tax=Allomuricauda sp. R78024 TaxID=3093867 RepID=UPI0037C8B8A0